VGHRHLKDLRALRTLRLLRLLRLRRKHLLRVAAFLSVVLLLRVLNETLKPADTPKASKYRGGHLLRNETELLENPPSAALPPSVRELLRSRRECHNTECYRALGVLAVMPENEVIAGEEVTLAMKWERSEIFSAVVDALMCVFDFSTPDHNIGANDHMQWHPNGGPATMYDVANINHQLVKTSLVAWQAADGSVLKCQVPEVPTDFENLDMPVTVLVSAQRSNGEVLRSAAFIRLRPSGRNVLVGRPSARYDDEGKDRDICICSFIQNDSSKLREWIEFHRLVGVGAFMLYDNNSTDGLEEVLSPYTCAGSIKPDGLSLRVLNWHHTLEYDQTQIQAFSHCLETFGSRPYLDWRLGSDGKISLVDKGPRHHLRALAEERPQCGLIAFIDVDEYMIPDPFVSREALDPDQEIPRIVRKHRRHDHGEQGVISIGMPWYAVASHGNEDYEPGPQRPRLQLYTSRSKLPHYQWKSIVARRFCPAVQNEVHRFCEQGAGRFRKKKRMWESVLAVDKKRQCQDKDEDRELCDPLLELVLYHFQWNSWNDFVTKYRKARDGFVLKLNESFIEEVNANRRTQIANGLPPSWPSLDSIEMYFTETHKDFIGWIVSEMKAAAEVSSHYNVQRYFEKLQHSLKILSECEAM